MKRTVFFIFLFVSCHFQAYGQEAQNINITLSGLNEELQQNVLAHLSLAKQPESPRLTEYLVKRLIQKAEKEVRTALEPFGYYQPEVKIDPVREGNDWKIHLHVDPGRPVMVSELRLNLSGPGSSEKQLADALARFPLQEGEILNHQLYETGKKELVSLAASLGYMDAFFSEHRVLVSSREYAASIHLSLDTGALFFFGPTTFEADFISHRLLDRMLPYSEGEPFSTRDIVRLRQSLYNSEYFDSVDVRTEEVPPGTTAVPVRVILTPKNPNKYGLGVGYGTDTGVRGTIEWVNRRLNRYGHQLRVSLQPSERKSYFGGVYTIPVKDPNKDRLALLAKWEKENFENTETEKRSTAISYDHIREAGEYSLYFNFLDEDYDTGIDTGHATLFMPGLKTTFRLADDRLVTKRGIRTTLDLTGSHESLLSDASFFQAFLASKGIWSFFDVWRVIGRFQLGGTVVDDFEDIPPSLRFYAGGDQSVRGFKYKSIGPRDAMGDVLGGQYLVTYSVELERKLSDSWSGALFFDSGDAFDSWTDLAMKNGAGFGIRWNAPFGQVRLDIANAVSGGGGSWRIHFNVGADL